MFRGLLDKIIMVFYDVITCYSGNVIAICCEFCIYISISICVYMNVNIYLCIIKIVNEIRDYFSTVVFIVQKFSQTMKDKYKKYLQVILTAVKIVSSFKMVISYSTQHLLYINHNSTISSSQHPGWSSGLCLVQQLSKG